MHKPFNEIEILRARWGALQIKKDETVAMFNQYFNQIRTYRNICDPEIEAVLVRADKDKLTGDRLTLTLITS